MLLFILGSTLLLALLFTYFFLRRHYGQVEKLLLPHVKPFLCFGSPPYNWHDRVHHEYFNEAFKRFKSKTFTRYAGSTPTIVTIDPEIVKQVTIKQFQNFPMVLNAEAKDKHLSLDISHGVLWKTLRKELSPVFTSGKLKGMMEPVTEIGDQFVAHIHKNQSPGKSLFIKDMFQGLTLDVINACAFGIKTNSREDPDHHLLQISKKMMESAIISTNWGTSIFFLLFGLFPELITVFNFFGSGYDKMIDVANSIIHQREKDDIQKKDFINVLVEMRKKSREDSNSLLNDDIITAQAVIFFLAGYVTTSLSFCSIVYVLATNPELQEKLHGEILLSEEEEYQETHYITAFIKETLRMYPPATLHTRVCTNDTEVEGIPVKKGTQIEMPIYASHYNPEFFPSPHEFKPERFLGNVEIIPNTYRPFGDGNRICIAYRFAMMELKVLTEKIVKNFKILPTSDTKLSPKKGALFLLEINDMGVEFESRV
uniref:Cytochrome P450 3A24 n=1 Tax=Caligus clemensi TaxID=344056 RepID=C1C148_CALCM|nr:Cytochrome P450 3A24 [Caligus clemensi]